MTIRTFVDGLRGKPTSIPPSNPIDMQLWASDGDGSYAKGYWMYDSDTTTWTQVGSGGGGLETFDTVNDAETAAGYSDNNLCYVVATDSMYRYEATSGVTRDGTYILNTNDGGTTRWQAVAGKYIYNELNVATGNITTVSSTDVNTTNLAVTAAETLSQIATPANPAAGKDKLYVKSNDEAHILTSAGTEKTLTSYTGSPSAYDLLQYNGSNFIPQYLDDNYIKNSDALYDTTGWATYADAAQSTPENGTGGSPNITLTRNTSSPLRGSADFKLTKDAANRQGEGCSYDYSIDSIDQSKPMYISGDYSVTSNYSYINNDLVFYIYDVTNAVLIQPVPYVLDGSGKFKFEFQSNAGSTSYRLIFHIATTNASAWDFHFVNVKVSATPQPSMINVQDKQYDLTVTSTLTGWSVVRAVGIPYKTKDNTWRLRFNIKGSFSSVANGAIVISGVVFKNTSLNFQAICAAPDSNVEYQWCTTGVNNGNIDFRFGANATGASFSGDVELESMPTWVTDFYPVQLGDGADTRVVAFESSDATPTGTINGSANQVNFTTLNDTHSAYNAGAYTCLVAGWYNIDLGIAASGTFTAGTNYLNLILKRNNVDILNDLLYATGTGFITHSTTKLVKCNAGDTLVPYTQITGTGVTYTAGIYHKFNISRISGPATISASEKVFCRYQTTSGQALVSGNYTDILYATKREDSHNSYNTSTGIFTAPISGEYFITGKIKTVLAGTTTMALEITYNGFATHSYTIISAVSGSSISISGLVKCFAGDQLKIRVYLATNTGSLDTSAFGNSIDIFSI